MKKFIKKTTKSDFEIEYLIDWEIFEINTVMKAAYELVDKVYMFFSKQWNDMIAQFSLKDKNLDLEEIVKSFWEELVYHKLRYDIDKKYWKTREKILNTALWFWVSLEEIKTDLDNISTYYQRLNQTNEIDDLPPEPEKRSIEDIVKDIESDPDFEEDKDEIISILREIEEESTEEK